MGSQLHKKFHVEFYRHFPITIIETSPDKIFRQFLTSLRAPKGNPKKTKWRWIEKENSADENKRNVAEERCSQSRLDQYETYY